MGNGRSVIYGVQGGASFPLSSQYLFVIAIMQSLKKKIRGCERKFAISKVSITISSPTPNQTQYSRDLGLLCFGRNASGNNPP